MMKFIKFMVLIILLATFPMVQLCAQNNHVVGNGVVLTPLPSPPTTNPPTPNGDENGDDNDYNDNVKEEEEEGVGEIKGRSLLNEYIILSLFYHTLYLYPDGVHDSMSLWVCDVNDNILIHEIFEMDGETKSLILPQNFIGEYRVYLKVGTQYYVGGIDL